MKDVIRDLKDFKNWWGKDGTGVPVWFFILTMVVLFIIGIIIIK